MLHKTAAAAVAVALLGLAGRVHAQEVLKAGSGAEWLGDPFMQKAHLGI